MRIVMDEVKNFKKIGCIENHAFVGVVKLKLRFRFLTSKWRMILRTAAQPAYILVYKKVLWPPIESKPIPATIQPIPTPKIVNIIIK